MKPTIEEFLSDLSSLDVKLWVDGDRLHCSAPKGVLTSTLQAQLAERKPEILTFLNQYNFDRLSARYQPLPTLTPNLAERHQPFPLNEMQQAYWIGRNSFFEGGNVAIHVYTEIESTDLDLERFNLAWQKLVERHDMLRAVVHSDGQQQILEQVPPYHIELLDLRGQDSDTIASKLSAIRDRLSHQVLPIDQFPLFEICATQLDDHHFRLHISVDGLCVDGWSAQVLLQDLVKFYQNPQINLPPLELSFRDYVLEEIAFQESPTFQRSLDYWQKRLPTLPPPPDLVLAKAPGSLTQPQFKSWDTKLEREIWQPLKLRAAKAGLTPTGILLAAYAEVLTLWSKSPRFTLNVPRFNRLPLHPQVNDIIGEFASFTLLEVDNSRQESFQDRARRLQEQLWKDLEHQYVSGVRVLRELSKIQGRTTGAIAPVVFTTTPQTVGSHLDSSRASLFKELGEVVYTISQTPQVWLDCQYMEAEDSLFLNWDGVEDMFPAGLVDDMFDAFCRLLRQLATEEEAWQEQRRQLIPPKQLEQRTAINDTAVPMPETLAHTLFAAQVSQRPQQAAVITPHLTLTYEELYRRSNQVGHRLRKLGALPNTLVAIVMEKGWEQIVSVMGVLASGAAYLPIDPGLPKERLWYLLENGEVKLVLTQSYLRERLEFPEGIQCLCLDNEELAGESDQPLEPVQKPDDLAYVIYTSGSTGLPKGVMVAHQSVVNLAIHTNQSFKVSSSDRVLALTALNHDLSVYDIFGLLTAGGTLVIPDASAQRDPAHWLELMQKERVTVWNSVPPMMEMLLDYAASRSDVQLPDLRLTFLGGDWLSVTLPNRLKALATNVRLVSIGGPTETTVWNIWYPVEAVNPDWKSIPYGRPIANTKYYVFNEALEDCPVWVPGELYCAGMGLAKGYWRNEEKTRANFINHPVTGERLYKTGDLGRYLPDGTIEFLGRADFQLKIRGYRIEPGEIEAALVEHPAVEASVVKAVGEQRGQERLVAYLVSDQEQAPAVDELRSFLREKLPEYMVPSAFVWLDTLPLSANGKIDRQAFPEPDTIIAKPEKSFVLPHTSLEKVMAGIWSEVLGVEQIGIHDNFFLDLGGNSLLATQVMAHVRETLQVELPLRHFFESPTVAEQVAVILQDSAQRAKVEAIAQLVLSLAELSDDEVDKMLAEKTLS
ncbi:MAG: amino acid adenylation domain-containing protein [Kastovskya adunca ATA6-11-RM4]|jgi:amino acid adenylation domain-containing protein|nr:amino acid adenylation domain-containing protein [Kastovskya adunca ATA6-11-RM4]